MILFGLLSPTFHCSIIPRLPSPGTAYGFNASVHGNGGQASFQINGTENCHRKINDYKRL